MNWEAASGAAPVLPRRADGQPARVLQLLRALDPGPEAESALAQSSALIALGGTALIAGAPGSLDHELKRRNIPFRELPLDSRNPWHLYRNVGRLTRLLREAAVDLVVVHNRGPAWSVLIAAGHVGVPLISLLHRRYPTKGFIGLIESRFNTAMGRGDLVLVSSDSVRDFAIKDLKVPARRLALVRPGIDLDIFDPENVSAARLISLSTAWRLPDGQPVILLPDWPPDSEMLLSALKRLTARDFVAVVAAPPEAGLDRRAIKAQVRAAGLEARCFAAEPCRDMAAAFKLADAVVVADSSEAGFRPAIARAQALGRPVVALAAGGAVEQIRPWETGYLVPPDDPAALAAAVEGALGLSATDRALFGTTARAAVAVRHDLRQATAEALACFSAALANYRIDGLSA